MKKIMLFIVLFTFSCLVYADVCIAGSDSCGSGDMEECISAEIMEKMEESEATLEEAAVIVPLVGSQAGAIPFNVTLNGSNGSSTDYEVYSLTNYGDEQGRIHDLVSSIKHQLAFGDCTRFAAMGALEIKLAKQYADILQTAKDEVSRNGGDSGIVEANLSEAYAKEIAGCDDDTIEVMKRIAKRDAVKEERYPFHDRYYAEPEYYSKRNVERYENFGKGCDNWNKKLQNKAKQEDWLRVQPGKPKKISGIEKVKNHIMNGEPVVMSYTTSCSEKQLNDRIDTTVAGAGWHMGKFDTLLYLKNKKNDKSTGHAVIVVGYMKNISNNKNPDYFIIKNSHYNDNILELFPLDDDFKNYCKPKYHVFGDGEIKVFLGERELDEKSLATTDFDNDGIPDIFDNNVYSLNYFADLPNVSYNPAQNEVDNDGIPIEKDFCTYIKDIAQADMDMNGVGDFCDPDIDGDGISNIDEGLSKEYLYKLSSYFFVLNPYKLTEKEYAALNPFIDGKTGKISGKYFVSEKFVKSKEITLTSKYISNIDFYLLPFNEDIKKTPKFQFIKDVNKRYDNWFFHNWYLGTDVSDNWIREFTYKDDNKKEQVSYGLKWNIPGLFEMKNIPYSQYKEDNYGENYPENFFNCMLHCKKLDELYSNQASFFEQTECEKACKNAYQCTIGRGIDRDCDGFRNDYDNCPDTYNPEQSDMDSDGDGIPDACDKCEGFDDKHDRDKDGVPDGCDKCEGFDDKHDRDKDGVPDACDKCEGFDDNLDMDKDGVPDTCDNCPNIKNLDQKDWDEDGIGDVCDKCPNHPDVFRTYRLNSEFISGATGAISQNAGKFEFKSLTNNHIYTWYYVMLPDSDLDGIPDSCDFGNTGDGFANSKIKTVFRLLKPKSLYTMESDPSVTIKLTMPENSGRGLNFCESSNFQSGYFQIGTTCNAAVHFCAIDYDQRVNQKLWGEDGYCSISNKVGGSVLGQRFGYSHGSDDFSPRSIESWRSRISVADSTAETRAKEWSDANKFVNSNDPNDDPVRKLVKVNSQLKNNAIIWNWRRDWYEKIDCLGANKGSDLCQNLLNGGDYDVENTMYAALSTSIVPVKGSNLITQQIPPYMINFIGINPIVTKPGINSAYFPSTNTNKFARASRYNIDPIELNYCDVSIPHHIDTEFPFPRPNKIPDIELCASCYFDIPIRFLSINEILPNDYISRYVIKKDNKNNALADPQRIIFPKDSIAFSEISPKEMIGVIRDEEEYFLALNTVESGADWNRIGRIEKWDFEIGEIESFAANYFIAKTAQGGKNLYSIELISEIPENLDDIIDIDEIPEMLYALNNLGDIGFDLEQTKLIFANGRLYLFAQNGNSFGMFWLDGTNFEEIQGVIPPKRNILNISASGKYMFLAGGTDFNNETMNDLWRFDTDTNTWEQIPATLKGDFTKVIMQEVNGKMVAFNPVIDDNTTFPVFEFENFEDVENIEVSYSVVKIDDIDFDQNFCILENNNSIFPGITNVYGECVKVQNYDFNEVTFPDYKLSVAGYKNSLYLGGLTGIRRVEIGENGEITKKEMIYSGESNNLAVYGNTLYAANYSEIDIFEIAEDGSISRKSSVKTSNCQNIRIYGGKLFAAENKRVRIFDLSDPIEPELLKTISLSNTVEDLEIAGNQLFVYENLNSLLTRKGKVSVFDISDLENTQKVSDFSQYCNDPEMQKSGNNVYLGCKNGSFKVEETGLQKVNGSKNYLREGYVYDGILYQVFSGTLHESKVEPEETEEDGWL